MSHTPLISIVIPAYNYADKLPRAVLSVLEQLTLSKHELIIINDGSTDNTEEVLSSLQNNSSKPFVIISQQNAGLAAVRNVGIHRAKGDYLVFLDADDKMHHGALQLIEKHIERNPQSQMIIGGYVSVAEAGGREKLTLPASLPTKPIDRVKAYLIDKKLSLANGATVMHKSIFANGMYPERFRSSEDLPVFSQALANNICSTLNAPLAIIFGHKTSLRHDTSFSEQVGMQLVDEIFSSGRLPGEMQCLASQFKAQRALSLFRSYYSAGLRQQAKDMYIVALKERWASTLKLSYTRKALRLFLCER